MTEGLEPGLEPGQEPTGEGGSPQSPDLTTENRRLAEENQKLRAERRKDRAEALVQRLKLPEAVGELLANVPIDEMETRAKAIAEQMQPAPSSPQPPTPPGTEGAPETPPVPPVEPPKEPADVEFLKRMTQGGSETPVKTEPPKTPDQELLARLQGAKTLEEVERIQHEMRAQGQR